MTLLLPQPPRPPPPPPPHVQSSQWLYGDHTLQIVPCAHQNCATSTRPGFFIVNKSKILYWCAPTVVSSFPVQLLQLWRSPASPDPACPPALSRHISRRTVWPPTWCVCVCVCDCDPVNSSKRDSRAIDEVDSIAPLAQPCVSAVWTMSMRHMATLLPPRVHARTNRQTDRCRPTDRQTNRQTD